MTLPGFNAIFLVLNSEDRFTSELVKTVDIFFKLFGKDVDEYVFVLFTHIESEDELKNFIKDGDKNPDNDGEKAFQELRKRCKDKLLFIENKASKDEKEEMVWNILKAVDEANAKASRPYFRNKITRELERKAKDFYEIHVCGLGSERSKEGNHSNNVLITIYNFFNILGIKQEGKMLQNVIGLCRLQIFTSYY
ncbi:hypothetical protein DPMN_017803 [Dreissena polymorpha]|uniref:AIG1-type G domain-containing protein n=1 Tax=Dreissena polymorpha TaxID=45954 RepID=A0A9D4S7T3_DREPO|nr:hypothetical protein DPMN_017803 [Dreissena polymorpha]